MVNVLFLIAQAAVVCLALLIALGLVKAARIWNQHKRITRQYELIREGAAKLRAHEAKAETWESLRKKHGL